MMGGAVCCAYAAAGSPAMAGGGDQPFRIPGVELTKARSELSAAACVGAPVTGSASVGSWPRSTPAIASRVRIYASTSSAVGGCGSLLLTGYLQSAVPRSWELRPVNQPARDEGRVDPP